MKNYRNGLAATALSLILSALASAQGYRVSENYEADPATADAGPVRLARVSFIQGHVSWRPDSTSEWSDATINLPLREGAQIWATDRARVEIQFDDGSYARLGGTRKAEGGVVTLQTLYSDAKGEFTELALNSGLLSMKLVNESSVYQVDTQALSIKASGPSSYRIGEAAGVEVVDREGQVSVQNTVSSSVVLTPGESLYAENGSSDLRVGQTPGADGWDNFVASRDQSDFGNAGDVPENIALTAGDLNSYGTWQPSDYGQAWFPRVDQGWRPYHDGHFVWVSPIGWTWCSNEPWGWAPYHYGTWVSTHHGWGWVPGPAQQCWSPAVVHFTQESGRVAWCPLAPTEVNYAALRLGFGPGGWTLGFSISSIACYYPVSDSRCEPRAFRNVEVNRNAHLYDPTSAGNIYNNAEVTHHHFVPTNARTTPGASYLSTLEFGRGGRPGALSLADTTIFQRGQSFSGRGRIVSGPPAVPPGEAAFTPTHTFNPEQPRPSIFNRPIFKQPVPPIVDHSTRNVGSNSMGRPHFFGGNDPLPARTASPAPAGTRKTNFGSPYPYRSGPAPSGSPSGSGFSRSGSTGNQPQPQNRPSTPPQPQNRPSPQPQNRPTPQPQPRPQPSPPPSRPNNPPAPSNSGSGASNSHHDGDSKGKKP